MRLRGSNAEIDLSIAGYQFPQSTATLYDSNWLNVRIRVTHQRGTWTAHDPSLLTYEVAELASWLDAVAGEAEHDVECSFLEPNLRFEVRAGDEGRMLRVYFELELRPPWAASNIVGEDELFIELPADPEQLRSASTDLRAQLSRFPQRTEY